MILEFYERLRGYDKWVETKATIESSSMNEIAHTDRSGNISYTYDSGDVLTWTDTRGEKQFADFTVDDESPLYQFVGGESVTIRYDPTRPDRFYYRDLLQSRIRYIFKLVVLGIIFATVLGFFIALRIAASR